MKLQTVVFELAKKTGLSVEACTELISSGWSYVEEPYRTPRWERMF